MKENSLFFGTAAFSLCMAALLLLVSGCSSPAQSKAMTPVGFKAARQHPGSVIVQRDSRAEASFATTGYDPLLYPEGYKELTASDFEDALLATVMESHVFGSVRKQPPADYLLSVNLVKTKREGSFTINQTVSARWQLTRLSDNRVVFDEFITTTGTATTGEAFVGMKRIRIALERAGQENIKQGLTKLSEQGFH